MAMNSILSGLLDSNKDKVGQFTLAKEIWDNIQDIYTREATLEMSKWKRTKEYETSDNSDNESNAEEAKFSRNPKKGSSKIKGKPLFKCFNCEEVGQCATKCPYLEIGKNN
jgi:hypothetical protein